MLLLVHHSSVLLSVQFINQVPDGFIYLHMLCKESNHIKNSGGGIRGEILIISKLLSIEEELYSMKEIS